MFASKWIDRHRQMTESDDFRKRRRSCSAGWGPRGVDIFAETSSVRVQQRAPSKTRTSKAFHQLSNLNKWAGASLQPAPHRILFAREAYSTIISALSCPCTDRRCQRTRTTHGLFASVLAYHLSGPTACIHDFQFNEVRRSNGDRLTIPQVTSSAWWLTGSVWLF